MSKPLSERLRELASDVVCLPSGVERANAKVALANVVVVRLPTTNHRKEPPKKRISRDRNPSVCHRHHKRHCGLSAPGMG